MFESGGILYVYKIYGIHHCINVVTEYQNFGSAVLIRALEPVIGTNFMKINRKTENIKNLCSGPGKITQAFGFTMDLNFTKLDSDNLFIAQNPHLKTENMTISKRIGISKSADLLLRYFIAGNQFASRL